MAYVTDGCINAAEGVRGGLPGGAARQHLRKADGSIEELPTSGVVTLGLDERIVSITGGGGGYGDPRERDAREVREDVREGWISAERAEQLYGHRVSGDMLDDPGREGS